MCDAIYIVNKKQAFKKITDGHFSDVKKNLTNGQKSDSFSASYDQHIKYTTSCTELCKFIEFKVVKQINPIGEINLF